METGRFDALTTRLARTLSRRRSLGLLATLGATATLVTEAEGKRKRKRKKPKRPKPLGPPCGAGCAVCNVCTGNACTPVANGTACGAGACVNGACVTCTGGQELVDNVCARRCTTTQADCVGESFCVNLAADSPAPQPDPRRICILPEGLPLRPLCQPSGRTDVCPAGTICVRVVGGFSACAEPGD